MIKVRSGTSTEEDICLKCGHLQLMKLDNNEEMKVCHVLKSRLRRKVVDCNSFEDTSTASLWDMQQIAWNLRTDKKGHTIGFASPAETKLLVKEGKMDKPRELD